MFTFRSGLAIVASACICAATPAQETPALGEPLTPGAVDAYDYVVLPDGTGLPAGSGTASEGREVYARHCLACHGERGRDGINDVLAGGHGSLDSAEPERTVGSYWPYATTVFDYVRRAMPYQQPGVLNDDEVYAVTAYLLYINGIVDLEARLDAETLPGVDMPNRDGFVWAYQPSR